MSNSPARPSVLPATWQVPEIFRRRLGAQVGRQRIMEAEGHLLLVLHAPPVDDDEVRKGRFFWLTPDGQWRSTEQGAGLASLQTHVAEFASRVERLDELEERATSSNQYFQVLSELSPLLRCTRNLHQVLQEARKAKSDLRELIDLRDQAYGIERSAELLLADANHALQYTMARQAEEQAEASHQMAVSSHRLNVLAAIFFPLATLSSLFGMNLKNPWEEAPPPWPFVLLTLAGLTLGFLLAKFMLRPSEREGT